MRIFLGAIVIALFNTVHSDLTLKYYENLLREKRTSAQTYELPDRNEEFRAGIESSEITDIGTYDFIIIGSGSAGSVLATRLSEISEWNVLLLEAGGEEDDFSNIPSELMSLQFSEKNWGYYTTPQTTGCLGMRGKRCAVPRGKLMGGTSAINAVLYSRGVPADYDKWAEMGNPGWSWEEVLPYFMKSENSQIEGDEQYHGIGGFWNVEYPLPNSELYDYFIEANLELNVPINPDYNSGGLGVSKTQQNSKRGKRQSTSTAFLDNARKRKNLRVITRALATKINIDPNSKSAEEVIFVTKDAKFSAKARKEILLSGGAYNSPQLLMLSGIGPKKHLQELGIEVIEDLPVGENLLEHPNFQGLVFRTNYVAQDNVKSVKDYLNGYGPLTSGANVDALAFINTKNDSASVPNIEYLFIPPGASMVPIWQKVFNYDEELTEKFLNRINPRTDITFFVVLSHPKSKGRVTLKSNNPIDFPNIDFNLWSESEDIDTLIEGVEFVLKLAKTKAFQELNATLVDFPICEEFEKYSRSYWECAIRLIGATVFHPCSTTAMGPDRATSVVDKNLKVHGIKKLRVVDAGVFPSTISGHNNAPSVMIAEKISDAIKKEYGEGIFSAFASSEQNYCYGSKEECYQE